MSKLPKRPTQAPQTPLTSDQLELLKKLYDAKAHGPKYLIPNHLLHDGDEAYWSDPELPGRLSRDWDRKYGPDEHAEMLGDFDQHIHEYALADEWARVWRDPKNKTVGKVYYAPENSKWDLVFKESNWLLSVIKQIESLARKHEIDERPIVLLALCILGDEILNDNDKREIRIFLLRLLEAVERERDGESPPPELPQVDQELNQVRYGKDCHKVSSDCALLFDELVKAYPHAISASALFKKPERLKNSLPAALKAIVKSKSAKGYWLELPG